MTQVGVRDDDRARVSSDYSLPQARLDTVVDCKYRTIGMFYAAVVSMKGLAIPFCSRNGLMT